MIAIGALLFGNPHQGSPERFLTENYQMVLHHVRVFVMLNSASRKSCFVEISLRLVPAPVLAIKHKISVMDIRDKKACERLSGFFKLEEQICKAGKA